MNVPSLSLLGRRRFLREVSHASAVGLFFPAILRSVHAQSAGRRLGVACIGVGGKGWSDMEAAAVGNEIVAICDVDADRLAKAAAKYPQARVYRDFRKMLEEVKSIEAVTVSTPDHSHYPAAMHAIGLGKHVCVQKPLVNTLWEARELHLAARKKGVITQMGNQGHTFEETRLVKEWLQAGVVGQVSEIHVWTNRPIWPQGPEASFKAGVVPESLDWQGWLAATPDHAYSPDIHPFKWRGFMEWGAGALGDMGCHNLDPLFWGLELGAPQRVEARSEGITDVAWPAGAQVKYSWSHVRGNGPVTLYWYEGKRADGLPQMPEPIPELKGANWSKTGFYIRGSAGVLYNQGDQAKNLTILPEARSAEFLAQLPEKHLPRSVTPGNPHQEWALAIKNGKPYPWMSQFDYAVPLTELCLLGTLAMRVGKPIEWDSEKLEAVGLPEARRFIKRSAYRAGWEYSSAQI
jgi:predicted dehydrogenase